MPSIHIGSLCSLSTEPKEVLQSYKMSMSDVIRMSDERSKNEFLKDHFVF